MFDELLMLIITIKQIAYYAILLSFKTGQLIVYGIQKCLIFISTSCSIIWTALVIITEDFGVFAIDFGTRLSAVLHSLMNSVDYIANIILDVIFHIQNGIYNTSDYLIAIYDGIINIITRLIISTSNLLSSIKYLFILFGHGVWFAVTIIPLSIAYVCISTTYLIGRIFEEFGNIVCSICVNSTTVFGNVYEFVTDVPIESFAGLLIAICLIYALIKCHILVFKFLRRLLTTFISKCQLKFTVPFKQDSPKTLKNDVCVICFDRSKCLLTMPCRHLCMCLECWDQLQQYQVSNRSRNCPVCRRNVQYTIHVY